ncbi:MAG: amino acid racemase [Bacteroidia bacterium]|nr:amino acid racemase [Bacteroidia bacterium]
MKLLGLIGGTSWHSTEVYYRLINEKVGSIIGTDSNPPLLMYSMNIQLMRSGDRESINAEYLRVARMLEQAGAEAIIICANTPHMVYTYVQPKISIPILHIAHAVGQQASRVGLKRLGLLGNRPTMTKGFIQHYLDEHFGISVSTLPEKFVERSHQYISKELTQGIFSDDARDFYLCQICRFKEKGMDGVILGCTELPILLEKEAAELPMIETTQLHAQMAVDFILSD